MTPFARSPLALYERWIANFNRNQTQPTEKQLFRVGALLDSVASRMPKTVKMLRFSVKPLSANDRVAEHRRVAEEAIYDFSTASRRNRSVSSARR